MRDSAEVIARDLAESYFRGLIKTKNAERLNPDELGETMGSVQAALLRRIQTTWPDPDQEVENAARMSVSLAGEILSVVGGDNLPSPETAAEWLTALYAAIDGNIRETLNRNVHADPYNSGAFRIAGDFLRKRSPKEIGTPPYDATALGAWAGGLFRGVFEGFIEANSKHTPSSERADAAWGLVAVALLHEGGFDRLDVGNGEEAGRWVAGLYARVLEAVTTPSS